MPIPPPPFKQRMYQCTCRVQNTGHCPDNKTIDNRDFAIGYGAGKTIKEAKINCQRDVLKRLGPTSGHHIGYHCINPKGEFIQVHEK